MTQNLSTSTAAQIKRLIELLRLRPHSTYELRKLGISHPAGRVNDLERRGYAIGSTRITTADDEGYRHNNVARYSLISEPKKVTPCE